MNQPHDPTGTPDPGPTPARPPTAAMWPPGYDPRAVEPPKRPGMMSSARRIFGAVGFIFALLLFGIYIGWFVGKAEPGDLAADTYRKGEGKEKIAIVPIRGVIGDEHAVYIAAAADRIRQDKDIKAVVLHVNSPGGFVSPTDVIWHHLKRLREDRPDLTVISHFAGVAASGGYYVAMATDHITAQPTCMTASIGVIAQAFTFQQLLNEKLGIKPETVVATNATEKDLMSMTRDWTERDRVALRKHLDAAYDQFSMVVAEGRNFDPDQVAAVATGRAMTATEALERDLIDKIGYLDDTLNRARDEANIAEPNPPVVMFMPRRSLLQQIMSSRAPQPGVMDVLPANPTSWRELLVEAAIPRRMFLMQP